MFFFSFVSWSSPPINHKTGARQYVLYANALNVVYLTNELELQTNTGVINVLIPAQLGQS